MHYDPENRLRDQPHYKQLLAQFFGVVLSKSQLTELKELPPSVVNVFVCGSVRDIASSVLARTGGRDIALVPVREFAYNERESDFGDERETHKSLRTAVSFRTLALRIPGLESTNDRLVPLSEEEDWYSTLCTTQEWYSLMHGALIEISLIVIGVDFAANHQDAPALRTGTYCSAAGPLPNSVWLQRCSTVFAEATQVRDSSIALRCGSLGTIAGVQRAPPSPAGRAASGGQRVPRPRARSEHHADPGFALSLLGVLKLELPVLCVAAL